MSNFIQNGFKNISIPIAVSDIYTPSDVGRAMIENGQQKQPFYVFDLDEAHRRIQHFKELMPRIKILYAMKSNDTEMMLKLVISQGLGFACASPGEMYKLRHLNVNPTSMIYAMPLKTPQQIIYAREIGVKYTTFDSVDELIKLKEFWPNVRLLLHIRLDSNNQVKLSEKFGCDFKTEAFDLLDKAAHLGLKVVGVTFHIDATIRPNLYNYVTALKHTRALFDYEVQAGRLMNIVDIGGGFCSNSTDSIDQLSKLLNSTLEDLFPDPEVQVIAEPGRYISDSAFTLYCNISNVRRVKKNDKYVNMIHINDGIYGTMRYTYEKWRTLSKFAYSRNKDTGASEETILWGPSCDSLDRVMEGRSVQLPKCMPLDWLVVNNHGAYTLTFATRFSSLEIPLIRPIISIDLWQSIKDMEVFSPSDFLLLPDISAPLPLTLPPLPQKNTTYQHLHTPTLKV